MPKPLSSDLPPTYLPQQVEEKWNDYWLENDYFKAGQFPDRKPYSIVIPPPNVTGKLHIGHALNNILQDILIRLKRMQGYDVLWLPGMDHAGIATQARVEARLREQGLSRYDLGREGFVKKTWEWKEEFAQHIKEQWKKMGLSLDYSRERFTLDPGLSDAVKEVFVSLYERGLIYRGKYMIHWDPLTKTALSDIEVIYKEVQGALYHLRYPLKDGSGSICVATTRPETMLGDTAVAVHPEDPRYREMVGKTVLLPIVNREIPIIADEFVDPEFGSGAVKVTPAHDPNDFEIGQRHSLPQIVVIDESGKMNEEAKDYEGMDRFECRKQIAIDLEKMGVLFEIQEYTHSVGHSERSGVVIEPYLSTQWFVSMKDLAKKAITFQKSNAGVRFVPERFEKIYLHWIENVRDWCVSRQLWWGHRIPAWYCAECSHMIVARETPKACTSCGSVALEQEEDVLDTWFSSALWPFSTLGWPEKTEDLSRYYPVDVLLTGYDIIYFWVARMIFTALEFTGQNPFKDVLITGIIRDEEGRKMSKSLGNGVDPMEVIEEYGADAMRFMLSTGCTPGNDQRFRFERVESARHFANKLWNASRFTLMHFNQMPDASFNKADVTSTADRYILHRLNETVSDVTRLLDRYEFSEAGRVLYNFIWDDFCDWYIEFSKIPLYGENPEEKRVTCAVLVHVLDQILRMLHPMMPFVTEEIWQYLGKGESLTIASWPKVKEQYHDVAAVDSMHRLMEIIRSVRNIRAEMGIEAKKQITLLIRPDEDVLPMIQMNEEIIKRSCNIDVLQIDPELEHPGQSVAHVVSKAELFIPLAGIVDIQQTIQRLEHDLEKWKKEVARVERMLSNEKFVTKAPEDVVEQERIKGKEYKEKMEKVRLRLAEIQAE